MMYISSCIGIVDGVWSSSGVNMVSVINPSDDLICNPSKYEHLGDGIVRELLYWDEPDWKYRFKVTKDQMQVLVINYSEWVQALYAEPKNPMIPKDTFTYVYVDTVQPEAIPLLEYLEIEIEARP